MTAIKKIAIVIAELGMPGGAEKVAADLVHEFHRRQYEVTVIKFDRPYPGEQLHQVPARIIDINVPESRGGLLIQLVYMLKRAWRFRRIFKHERFDHIFSFLEASNLPVALASPQAVLSMHLDPEILTRKELVAIHWVYPRVRRVITVSRQMEQALVTKTGLHNTRCIYNPVDTALIRERALQPLAFDKPFILAVGRLAQQKRFDLLLEAFAVTETVQHCQLLLVGAGALQAELEAKIVQLDLVGQVQLTGFDDNPYRYMAQAEFLVMSSDYEGYPLVLIEALTLGCPVISTDCPTGPREIIQHDINGILVEKGNVEAIAAGIDRLYYDENLRSRLREQAPGSVQANDIAEVADQWLAA